MQILDLLFCLSHSLLPRSAKQPLNPGGAPILGLGNRNAPQNGAWLRLDRTGRKSLEWKRKGGLDRSLSMVNPRV